MKRSIFSLECIRRWNCDRFMPREVKFREFQLKIVIHCASRKRHKIPCIKYCFVCTLFDKQARYISLPAVTNEEKAMTHIGPPNRASEPDWKLKFSTFENPRWRSLTDENLTEQHWQPVFLFSKPIVSIHVCCSYIELSRPKLHKTGDLQVGNWHVNFANILVLILCCIRLHCKCWPLGPYALINTDNMTQYRRAASQTFLHILTFKPLTPSTTSAVVRFQP